jgi:aspartyl/glutamyl-tRNA(Asn/Gln) amidotransferase C subunit
MEAVRLARLDLDPAELDRILTQVSGILAHIEELEAVPLGDAPALGGIAETDAPLRSDVRDPDPLATPPAALAPEWMDGFFALPRLAAMDASRESPE